MMENSSTHAEQLECFASCGSEYAMEPLLIFDLRGNRGGSDQWLYDWFHGWTGDALELKMTTSTKLSQLSCQHLPAFFPGLTDSFLSENMGTRTGSVQQKGEWVERQGFTFVLIDKDVASSGEGTVSALGTVENVVFVGGPTKGCDLTPNNYKFFLPITGIQVYFGMGLSFTNSMENFDGVGNLPDLWVNPPDAMDAVLRMIDYYGLKQ